MPSSVLHRLDAVNQEDSSTATTTASGYSDTGPLVNNSNAPTPGPSSLLGGWPAVAAAAATSANAGSSVTSLLQQGLLLIVKQHQQNQQQQQQQNHQLDLANNLSNLKALTSGISGSGGTNGSEGTESGNDLLQQGHSANQFIGPTIISPAQNRGTLFPGMRSQRWMNPADLAQRPFQCEYCTSRFKSKNNLRQHTRLHTGERPYVCNICNETFVQMSSLQHHRAKKHNTK